MVPTTVSSSSFSAKSWARLAWRLATPRLSSSPSLALMAEMARRAASLDDLLACAARSFSISLRVALMCLQRGGAQGE